MGNKGTKKSPAGAKGSSTYSSVSAKYHSAQYFVLHPSLFLVLLLHNSSRKGTDREGEARAFSLAKHGKRRGYAPFGGQPQSQTRGSTNRYFLYTGARAQTQTSHFCSSLFSFILSCRQSSRMASTANVLYQLGRRRCITPYFAPGA